MINHTTHIHSFPVFLALCALVFLCATYIHWEIVNVAKEWVFDDGSVIKDNPMLKGDLPLSQLLYR